MSKDWKIKRREKVLKTSASQHETFNLCKRKWWLSKVRRLQEGTTHAQALGTVLHAVCERYLLADDLGRDPKTGQPVDLYPENWYKAYNKYDGSLEGECTPAEQQHIKRLIAKAIEAGVLERLPGRLVEQEFNRPIITLPCAECSGPGNYDCKACYGSGKGVTVTMNGFIDLGYRDQIQDHKTTKAMKWAKTPETLKANTQILIYAKQKLLEAEEKGQPVPKTINLRHNVYCKDVNKPVVKKVETEVSREYIEYMWKTIIRNAAEMAKMVRTVDRWSDAPDPVNMSNACNAYGGCAYRSICNGRETEESYEARLVKVKMRDSIPAAANGVAVGAEVVRVEKKEQTMDFAAKLRAKREAKAAGGTEPPKVNPAPVPTKLVDPKAPKANGHDTVEVLDQNPPPWADSKCGACKGVGFNTKGSPCRICDASAKRTKGRPTSSEYIIEPDGEMMIWQSKADPDDAGASPLSTQAPKPVAAKAQAKLEVVEAPEAEPEAEEVQEEEPAPAPTRIRRTKAQMIAARAAEAKAKAQEEEQVEEEEPEAEEEQVEEAEEEQVEEEEEEEVEVSDVSDDSPKTAKGGRPKKGFLLLINCAPIRGHSRPGSGRNVHFLNEVLQRYGATMAAENGVESYYDINAFDRRDALCKAASRIVTEFGADMVVASGIGTGQSDLRALLDAIRPYAGMEIVSEQL